MATSRKAATKIAIDGSPFIKVVDDKPVPASAKRWDWVYDTRSKILLAAEIIEGEFTFEQAGAAAAKTYRDARSLHVQEIVAALDYSRHGPAADPRFFRWKPRWVWTGTTAAWNTAGLAWLVYLDVGDACFLRQSDRCCALAGRPSQDLGL